MGARNASSSYLNAWLLEEKAVKIFLCSCAKVRLTGTPIRAYSERHRRCQSTPYIDSRKNICVVWGTYTFMNPKGRETALGSLKLGLIWYSLSRSHIKRPM